MLVIQWHTQREFEEFNWLKIKNILSTKNIANHKSHFKGFLLNFSSLQDNCLLM